MIKVLVDLEIARKMDMTTGSKMWLENELLDVEIYGNKYMGHKENNYTIVAQTLFPYFSSFRHSIFGVCHSSTDFPAHSHAYPHSFQRLSTLTSAPIHAHSYAYPHSFPRTLAPSRSLPLNPAHSRSLPLTPAHSAHVLMHEHLQENDKNLFFCLFSHTPFLFEVDTIL